MQTQGPLYPGLEFSPLLTEILMARNRTISGTKSLIFCCKKCLKNKGLFKV